MLATMPSGDRTARQARPEALRAAGPRRRMWLALWLWTAAWAAVHLPGAGYSWHYFAQGARLLTAPGATGGGLHLYAAHPDLQFGPLTLAVSAVVEGLGAGHGQALAILAMTAAGPALLWLLARISQVVAPGRGAAVVAVAGVALLPVWAELAVHYAHLDDVLALVFAVAAFEAHLRRRPALTGLLIALAVDSKPWTLGLFALAVVLPSPARARLLLTGAAAVTVAWLPFLLAAPATLALGSFRIDNVDDSALRALGVTSGGTPPWDRPAQLALGALVAAVAARRGRPAQVLLAVVAARMLLDPGTYPYYAAGLCVAAALADAGRADRRFPLMTCGALGWFVADQIVGAFSAAAAGGLRAGYCLVVLGVLCLPRHRTGPDGPGQAARSAAVARAIRPVRPDRT